MLSNFFFSEMWYFFSTFEILPPRWRKMDENFEKNSQISPIFLGNLTNTMFFVNNHNWDLDFALVSRNLVFSENFLKNWWFFDENCNSCPADIFGWKKLFFSFLPTLMCFFIILYGKLMNKTKITLKINFPVFYRPSNLRCFGQV